jgi:glucan 1,3-beta-glucosidase
LNKPNVTRTVDTIRFLAKTVGSQVSVIELLNEPGGYRGDDWANVTRQFWLDGYAAVREVLGLGVQVMIGDAFLGINVNFIFIILLQ